MRISDLSSDVCSSDLWESKVSHDLGERVFDELFPRLAAAIARNDTQTARPLSRQALDDIHHAALIVLYRLLFVLYAEDRALLPVNDSRYDDYSLRSEEHTSELQSLMRISYAVFCLKQKNKIDKE